MIIDSGVVTGSLQVSGSLNVKGNLTVDGNINGTITGSVTSASYATFAVTAATASYILGSGVSGNITGNAANITAYTINQNLSTTSQVSFAGITGSLLGTASTASVAQQVSTSISTQNIQHNVLFIDTTGPGLVQVDGGLRYNPNQDLLTTTSSLASLAETASYVANAVSASRATSAANADTASFVTTAQTASYVANAVSASRATSAASADNSTLFNSLSSSQFPQLVVSNTFTGNNVFGNITASNAQFNTASIQYLNVVYETSSIIFSSGSNQLGDASNDVQTLWGTVTLPSGPLQVTGSLIATNLTGSLNGTNLVAASVANDRLTNSSVTVTAGTGMSGGGAVALGSSVTLTNAGVTSNVAGTGISVSGATGAVTITNTGVTSNVAGTGVTVSGATGAVTVSIGQAVATSSNVQFNSLGVGTAGSAVAGEIRATADVTAYYSSDERLKENITPIENPIEKLMSINGVTFSWKEGFETLHSHVGSDTGVVAQQIEAINLPGTVTTRETGYMAVNYEKLNALLIEGFKAQQGEINELKEIVKTLLNK